MLQNEVLSQKNKTKLVLFSIKDPVIVDVSANMEAENFLNMVIFIAKQECMINLDCLLDGI